jgi:hypothetical protein
MQGYSKVSVQPLITVHNNGKEETFFKAIVRVCVGPFMTCHLQWLSRSLHAEL